MHVALSDFGEVAVPVSQEYNTDSIPTSSCLAQNYPNPFNHATQIIYSIPSSVPITLEIYNTLGQVVRVFNPDQKQAGTYSVTWDGYNDQGYLMPSGIYIYTLTAGDFSDQKKMLLIK